MNNVCTNPFSSPVEKVLRTSSKRFIKSFPWNLGGNFYSNKLKFSWKNWCSNRVSVWFLNVSFFPCCRPCFIGYLNISSSRWRMDSAQLSVQKSWYCKVSSSTFLMQTTVFQFPSILFSKCWGNKNLIISSKSGKNQPTRHLVYWCHKGNLEYSKMSNQHP